MTAVTVRGLSALRRRFDATRASKAVKRVSRREADAIAKDAAHAAPGQLGNTVEVRDASRGEKIAYAVGTAHRAGRFIEHGTVRRPAAPWLFPVFRARLPRIKQNLRNTLVASFKRSRGEV